MKRKIFQTILLAAALITINACSNDNSVQPTESDSVINGNWKTGSWTSTGGEVIDSLVVNLTLQEKDGAVSGSGTASALFQEDGNAISVVITGNVTGSYTDAGINIVLSSSVTDAKYTYSGIWKEVNTSFTGTAVINAFEITHIHNESTLYKGE